MELEKNLYTGYLYAYFRWIRPGQDLQQVYFALSRDGLHFVPLNNNRPVIEATLGTKGIRDPHIFRSELDGKFYLLGTDLDANKCKWREYMAYGSKSMSIWQSDNLVDWGEQSLAVIADETIGCVWAPKVCFDKEQNKYAMFFSGSEAGTTNLKVWYVYTSDFVSFTKPRILIDKQENTSKAKWGKIGFAKKWITFIDSTTVPVEGSYYRFTKNEVLKTIQCETSDHAIDDYTMVEPLVAGERGVEGPCVYKLIEQDKWILLLDGHLGPNSGKGYFPLSASTQELKKGIFHRLSEKDYSLPEGCKHGSVMPVTQDEYERLLRRWPSDVNDN